MTFRDLENNQKLKLFKYVEGLPFQSRVEVSEALRSRTEQKMLNKSRLSSTYFQPKEIINLVKDFDVNYKNNMVVHKELKIDNSLFLNKYKLSKKILSPNKNNEFENVFADLLIKYVEKGNKNTQDLKVKDNLFELSPLLIDNKKIIDNFILQNNKEIYKKDLDYLKKIKEIVNQRLVNHQERKKINTKQEKIVYNDIQPNFAAPTISKKNLIDEIKKNEYNIKLTSEALKNNDLKDLFLEYSKTKTDKFIERNKPVEERKKDVAKNKVLAKSLTSTRSTFYESKSNNIKNRKCSLENDILQKSKQIDLSLDKIEEEGFPDLFKLRENYKTNESKNLSMFSLMKKSAQRKSLSDIKIQKKPLAKIILSNSTLDDEKKKFKNEIESKIYNKKYYELEKLNEKMSNNLQYDYSEIVDYFVDKAGRDRNIIEEGLKKKLGSNEIFKYFADLKTKVLSVDFNESYKNFTNKMGNLDINQNNLKKIR